MIISVTNQKGGVGKTTTSHSMSVELAKRNFKVLLIDFDPQANLSFSFGVENKNLTIYEILKNSINITDVIQKGPHPDIVPANILLSGAELEFNKPAREYLLKAALEPVIDKYDYIIIDTPPALSILTVNAYTVSDKLIVPMGVDGFSMQGVGQLKDTISLVKKYCNPKLEVAGILLVKYNPRTVLSKHVTPKIKSEVAPELNTKVFNTYIRTNISVQEAQIQQLSMVEYAPEATSQIDYSNFVEEFLQGINNG